MSRFNNGLKKAFENVFDDGAFSLDEAYGEEILRYRTPDSINSPWVDNGDFTYSIDGTQSTNVYMFNFGILEQGCEYKFVIIVSGSTADGVRPDNTDLSEAFTVGNGKFEYEFVAGSNSNFNIQANSTFAGTVQYSLKKKTL